MTDEPFTCEICVYSTPVTRVRLRCHILDRGVESLDCCHVCKQGLRQASEQQERLRDKLKALNEEVRDLLVAEQDRRIREREREDPDYFEYHDYEDEAIYFEKGTEGWLRSHELDRVRELVGKDLAKALRYLWPHMSAEDRLCPRCGWQRRDDQTERCPEHLAKLVPT